jgi:O-methyltransferase
MLAKTKYFIKEVIAKLGYQILPVPKTTPKEIFPKDLEEKFRKLCERCAPYTMTSIERMYALYQAVNYLIRAKIPGDFVECGVWRGGSSMLAALTALDLAETTRNLYLYDTFCGMPEPTEKDREITSGRPAREEWELLKRENHNEFCYASFKEVQENLARTAYPPENIIYVQGKVEETIPGTVPGRIALLRLDTDWYESTWHELKHLYPLLVHGGVIIIDDYGYWSGAKESVDKYFAENKIPMLLQRIDYTGRMGIKD